MITPEVIRKLAELSALCVSSEDETVYAQQLTRVIRYMDVLRDYELPADSTSWPIHTETHTRADHPQNLDPQLPPGFHQTPDGFPVPKISTAQS